ncbi:hypothetical protein CC80DRAFT_461247 [Byssothecium circinans]|uniref:Glycosyltransferase family 2 protein n=1 Tax=Byssothecium circinans TaxID=147558 RepID=A0A6A5UEW4_9PLEO|nr:hypothetical protein CC80DRAFT_461247 [Byssothecium circinans]
MLRAILTPFQHFASEVWHWTTQHSLALFTALFLFRYIRAISNLLAARFLYKPIPISATPMYTTRDVTVVISTTSLSQRGIHSVIRSILAHDIPSLILTTSGMRIASQIANFNATFTDPRITVLREVDVPNIRRQVLAAMPRVKTPFFVRQDDHTDWPQNVDFIPSLLAPLENEKVAAVGPVAEACRTVCPVSFKGFGDFIGRAYLQGRSREFRASTSIDGGISCLEGRFGLFRTSVFTDQEFIHAYTNEYYTEWWGYGKRRGPLNADDDIFHTKWIFKKGWSIKIQAGRESVLISELGRWPQYFEQTLRWSRTGWRTNAKELTGDLWRWRRFPYSFYAVVVYAWGKNSLLHDICLFVLLGAFSGGREEEVEWWIVWYLLLAAWIVGVRVVKIFPLLWREPRDVIYVPGYLVWIYVNALIRIYAFWTCGKTEWRTVEEAMMSPGRRVTFEDEEDETWMERDSLLAGRSP